MRRGWTAEEWAEWAGTEPISQTNTQKPKGLRERMAGRDGAKQRDTY